MAPGLAEARVAMMPGTTAAGWVAARLVATVVGVAAGGEGCNQGCQDVLVNSRNIHMLLGKSSGRLERVYLPDSANLDLINLEELQAAHPYLIIHPSENSAMRALLQDTSADWDMRDTRYFVVTPDNQTVLYYTQEHDGGGLLEDLKHLLKYSPNR